MSIKSILVIAALLDLSLETYAYCVGHIAHVETISNFVSSSA